MLKEWAALTWFLAFAATHSAGWPSFRVLAVSDGNTLRVRGLASYYPFDGDIVLVGIWSDSQYEPQFDYARRLEFMKTALEGKIVRAQITGLLLYTSLEPLQEVFLEDGTSVNEMLLREGYAMLDNGPPSGLFADELSRFKTAEAEAIRSRRGIWAEDNLVRREAKVRMQQEQDRQARHWEGFGFFATVQALLTVSIVWLVYLVRHNQPACLATVSLFLLPVGLLTPDLIRWSSDPAIIRLGHPVYSIYGVLVGCSFLMLALLILVVLVAAGPALQWSGVSLKIRGALLIFFSFVSLWVLIAVFALVYRLRGVGEWSSAFGYSSSIALGFPTTAIQSEEFTITLIERVLFVVWLGLSAAAIRPATTLPARDMLWNLAVALVSLLIVTIAVASAFALSFFAILATVNRRESFWFSLATLFRQGYPGISGNVHGIRQLQILEVHVALFFALIGFRVIFALPWRTFIGSPRGNAGM